MTRLLRPGSGTLRLALVALAVLVAAVKLTIAYRTAGTNDVRHWTSFVDGVRRYGPVDVYQGTYSAVFNHPPLVGWWLAGVDAVSRHVGWLPVRFLVRVPATVADVLTALVVFELLVNRRTPREAVAAGALVAASPVLVAISGFHGNTDSVFVLLALAAAWLLVDRNRPLAGGLSIGFAISVKLIPVVALPVLLAAAWRQRRLLRFTAGTAGVFAVLWVPVLVRHWGQFTEKVLGYPGTESNSSPWGLPAVAHALGVARDDLTVLAGPGRLVILLICMAVPLLLTARRPDAVPYGVGLGLVLVWLLSPAFAPQYFAWAVAAACLLSLPAAAAYTLLASVLLVDTYTRWSGGFPWDQAQARGLSSLGTALCLPVWLALGAVAVLGILRIRNVPPVPRGEESGS